MDLILWRHAFARRLSEESPFSLQDDLARELTPKGHAQAKVASRWLRQHLPASTRVISSPANRCLETAAYLEMDLKVCEQIQPETDGQAILTAARWPDARQPVLVVGHQPALGEVLARLLLCNMPSMPVRKAGIWWLRYRVRDGVPQTTVFAVVCPESLHG